MSLRYLFVESIKIGKLPKGTVIDLRRVQSAMYSQWPRECEDLGFTSSKPIEEKFKKDIRWGLQDAKNLGLLEHVGSPKSGLWRIK